MNSQRFLGYWRQKLFSGSATPPKYLRDNKKMLETIQSKPYSIGITTYPIKSDGKQNVIKFTLP